LTKWGSGATASALTAEHSRHAVVT
jgi:hypothetical protein